MSLMGVKPPYHHTKQPPRTSMLLYDTMDPSADFGNGLQQPVVDVPPAEVAVALEGSSCYPSDRWTCGTSYCISHPPHPPLTMWFARSPALRSLHPHMLLEYDQAVQQAPDLVRSETPFVDFLRTELNNIEYAVSRIVLYWKYRKQLFQDRWLLPMNQTGSGCLNAEDIALLRTGFMVVQQRPAEGPILLHDMSRARENIGAAVARVVFYLAAALPCPLAQTQGITVLHVVTSAPRPPVETDPSYWRMIMTGLPFRYHRVMVVQSVEEGREHLIEYLAYQQARVTEFCSGLVVERLTSSSVAGLLQLLFQNGIPPEYVPCLLGGQYNYEPFYAWIQSRVILESATAAAWSAEPRQDGTEPPALPMAFLTGPPPVPRATALEDEGSQRKKAAKKVPSSSSTTATRDADFLRRRNAMYVRRFHERQQQTTESLREQARTLSIRNQTLRAINLRLEEYLEEAHRMVAAYERGHG